MNTVLIAILGGCLIGGGLWVWTALLVPQRVDLELVLNADRGVFRPPPGALTPGKAGGRPLQRVQRRVEARLARLAIATPDADLAVIELSRGEFLLIRLGAVFAGLLVGPLYGVIFAVFGLSVSVLWPVGFGIVLAVVGWFVVADVVHGKAEARRREMRYALVSFLTLVALHRAAGQGMSASLELAASSSTSWTFARIGQRISSSVRAGAAPWDGLAGLAAELGIEELADIASIADLAGTGGAGVYSTLLSRAKALRLELQSKEEAAALVMSARMVAPKAMLGIVTLLFLLYPAVMTITGS